MLHDDRTLRADTASQRCALAAASEASLVGASDSSASDDDATSLTAADQCGALVRSDCRPARS
jgi:hypothetical protein